MWDFHEQAFGGLAVRLVGHNPDMAGVKAADNWGHLKKILQTHRFYIHTAEPELEAGYNMAMGEAMMTGMPVLGNKHPTSLIKHGVSGFLSDDPAQLRKYAKILLEYRELAAKMGQQAHKTAMEFFSIERFKKGFLQSIETARQKWESRVIIN